jgi:two-component system nitrate/nitrite response regulator NarL
LISDDNDLLRDTLVMFLESEGLIETASAGTFKEKCARIESDELFNLVLLDYNMPSMNGL